MRKIIAAAMLAVLTFHTGVVLGDAIRAETKQITTGMFEQS